MGFGPPVRSQHPSPHRLCGQSSHIVTGWWFSTVSRLSKYEVTWSNHVLILQVPFLSVPFRSLVSLIPTLLVLKTNYFAHESLCFPDQKLFFRPHPILKSPFHVIFNKQLSHFPRWHPHVHHVWAPQVPTLLHCSQAKVTTDPFSPRRWQHRFCGSPPSPEHRLPRDPRLPGSWCIPRYPPGSVNLGIKTDIFIFHTWTPISNKSQYIYIWYGKWKKHNIVLI